MPGRSCSTQLLQVLDYLTQHLDNGYCVDVIYFDFQKAFDAVPPPTFIAKVNFFWHSW